MKHDGQHHHLLSFTFLESEAAYLRGREAVHHVELDSSHVCRFRVWCPDKHKST